MTKQIDKIMEQAQVFASAWSLVGGRFDGGTAMDDAEDAKNELRQMVTEALAEQPAQQCKWPTCQSEEYQQALAEQIKRELVGEQPAQQEYASFAEWAHDYVQDNLHKLKPAQRTWVWLTDVERVGVQYEAQKKRLTPLEFMELHEAKLKEKNT